MIEHMNNMPYKDAAGRVYSYGEYFPMEFSSYPYNNSFANFFFPKTKEEATAEGLTWHDANVKEYNSTMKSSELPDNIKDTKDEIIKEIITCANCPKSYKITKQELDLSRKLNVPLSRVCPFCSIKDKVNKWVAQMKQVDRTCDTCGITFKTHYTKDEAPGVLCKKCYQQEVV